MSLQQPGGVSAESWQVEQLRTTAFVLGGQAGDLPETWWRQVVGGAPEEQRSRPQQGIVEQFGLFQGMRLNVVWRSDRVDWRLIPNVVRSGQPLDGFPVLGAYSDALKDFVELSKKGLDNCGPMIRLASGAVLLKRVPNLEAAYAVLASYLPSISFDLNGATDFLYQINRPRSSRSVDSLVINRLTKWSVFVGGMLSISLTGGSPVLVPGIPGQHVCRLELDINTVPSTSAVDAGKVNLVFQELVNFGFEIAENGDIP